MQAPKAIPGVGPLTATAVVASVGDAREFRSGREFAAWLGVVPRQSGTGGRTRCSGPSESAASLAGQVVADKALERRSGRPSEQNRTGHLGALGPRTEIRGRLDGGVASIDIRFTGCVDGIEMMAK